MKNILRGLLATALLSGPMQVIAGTVTVWDTLQSTPGAFGVQVGCLCIFPTDKNYVQGTRVEPSDTGYLTAFGFFGARFNLGGAGWQFALRADDAGQPGAILESLSSVDVGDPAIYGGNASGSTLIKQGVRYWFTASLPSPTAGLWYTNDSINGSIASSSDNGSSWTISPDFWVLQLRLMASTPSSVPEPSTLLLLSLGIAAVGLAMRHSLRRPKSIRRHAETRGAYP